MDNLAHSLFGAVLAETGLRRVTPLATATLVVGANLPDVDALTTLAGEDTAMFWRRGITHGVPALLLWPVILTAVMLLLDRARARRGGDATPSRPGWLLALSAIGIWSHTALDWLNVYGVRWLMPFDGRWFYADTLFIVDPWFWLLGAAAVVLARTSRTIGVVGWSVVGLATTALVVSAPFVGTTARVTWLVAVTAILAARLTVRDAARVRHIASVSVALLLGYIGLMAIGSARARGVASEWLTQQGVAFERVVANPVAADSFRRQVIVVREDRYMFVDVSLLDGRVAASGADIERGDGPAPVIAAALARPEHRGLRNWLRLPAYETYRVPGGWRVVVRDVRYANLGRRGPGEAVVEMTDDEIAASSRGIE